MANELVIHHPTGCTLYALLFDATGQIYNGSTFGAPGSASWTDYDIAMSEVATATGIYRASMPGAAAGAYGWTVRRQAGASPAVTDIAVGAGRIEWDGTAEIMPASTTNIEQINSVTGSIGGDVAGKVLGGGSGTITGVGTSANVTQWKGATAPDASTFANAGTYSYSNTVDDGSGNLIDGAYVELATDSAMTNVVNATHTNSLGAFTVYSDTAGTHYLRITIGGYEVGTATVTTA